MSTKSLIQIFIFFLIIAILGNVYYTYFNPKEKIITVTEISESIDPIKIKELEKEILKLELSNKELKEKIENNKKKINKEELSNFVTKNNVNQTNINNNITNEKKIDVIKNDNIIEKEIVKNLVKDVEYTSIDQKGNKFYLLASSGKSNTNNKDVLDLQNVRGEIISDKRETIYITSNFAHYNSSNLNSKFYENVIINYQDKEITSKNFDINMETNKAIAYNDVIISDTKSVMKAGIVEFDLKTKDLNINPEVTTTKVEIITN